MSDVVSWLGSPIALNLGLRWLAEDSLTRENLNDWRPAPARRIRKQIPTRMRTEARSQADAYVWRAQTEKWIAKQIAANSEAGIHLRERRDRVLAALGMALEQARRTLTFEGKRGDE